MDAELEARLRRTADKQEIYDALMRYCQGIDRRDRDLIASAFHPDAIDDHGTPVGAKEFADRAGTGPATHKMQMHFIGNVRIEVEGDVAYAESYCVAYLTLLPKDGVVNVGGMTYVPPVSAKEYDRAAGLRYIDRFERRNGEWKIAHRIVVDDWQRVDPVPDPAPSSPHGRRGSQSREDPYYTFRSGKLGPARHSA